MSTVSGQVTGAGGKGFSAEIRIDGLEETLAALRALAPDVEKRMQRTIKEAAQNVASAASGTGPPGHPMSYRIQSSRRGKNVGMKIRAADAESAIFEFAGTKMLSRTGGPITPQGAAMVRWLDGFGKPGRFLWQAWDDHKDAFEAVLKDQMAEAERVVQERLTAAGETF